MPLGAGSSEGSSDLQGQLSSTPFFLQTQPGETQSRKLGFLPVSAWVLHAGSGGFPAPLLSPASGQGSPEERSGDWATPGHMVSFVQ